jgi:hypothetical protein
MQIDNINQVELLFQKLHFVQLWPEVISLSCTQHSCGNYILFSIWIEFNPNYGKGWSDRPITGSWIVQADLVGPIEIPLIWRV